MMLWRWKWTTAGSRYHIALIMLQSILIEREKDNGKEDGEERRDCGHCTRTRMGINRFYNRWWRRKNKFFISSYWDVMCPFGTKQLMISSMNTFWQNIRWLFEFRWRLCCGTTILLFITSFGMTEMSLSNQKTWFEKRSKSSTISRIYFASHTIIVSYLHKSTIMYSYMENNNGMIFCCIL